MIRLQELELVFGHTDGRTDGWTDRRDVGNSILNYGINKDFKFFYVRMRSEFYSILQKSHLYGRQTFLSYIFQNSTILFTGSSASYTAAASKAAEATTGLRFVGTKNFLTLVFSFIMIFAANASFSS